MRVRQPGIDLLSLDYSKRGNETVNHQGFLTSYAIVFAHTHNSETATWFIASTPSLTERYRVKGNQGRTNLNDIFKWVRCTPSVAILLSQWYLQFPVIVFRQKHLLITAPKAVKTVFCVCFSWFCLPNTASQGISPKLLEWASWNLQGGYNFLKGSFCLRNVLALNQLVCP